MYNHVSQHNDKYCIVASYIKLKVIGILGIHVPTYTINIKLFTLTVTNTLSCQKSVQEYMILENR